MESPGAGCLKLCVRSRAEICSRTFFVTFIKLCVRLILFYKSQSLWSWANVHEPHFLHFPIYGCRNAPKHAFAYQSFHHSLDNEKYGRESATSDCIASARFFIGVIMHCYFSVPQILQDSANHHLKSQSSLLLNVRRSMVNDSFIALM